MPYHASFHSSHVVCKGSPGDRYTRIIFGKEEATSHNGSAHKISTADDDVAASVPVCLPHVRHINKETECNPFITKRPAGKPNG